MKKFIIRFSLLLGVIGIILLFFIPLMKDIKYGLDLQGGFEVLYEVSPLEGDNLTRDMLTATYKTISKRIDVLGVMEPDIIIEGDNRIRVRLAGVTNREEARDVLSKAASLSFRDTKDNLLMTSSVLKAGSVKTTADDRGTPAVLLPIKDVDKFYNVTNKVKDYEDNRIVIWLDFEEGIDSFVNEESNCGSLSSSKCLSAATVSQAFASDVIIQGNFTKEEATALVDLINSGSLPTKLTEISSKMVDATFGKNSLNSTLLAGSIGVLAIVLFLTLVYRFSGFIAGLSIIIYTFLTFLIFWLIGGVLTLPGIASLILGIGMAVDANILSFERIKEELWAGKSLKEAFKLGNQRSLSTIMDANITTLLVGIILFFLGESSTKGFATMLIINIFVTIIVMVFVVKYIVGLFVDSNFFDKRLNLFVGVKEKDISKGKDKSIKLEPYKKIDFMKYRKYHVILPLIILIIGGLCIFKDGLNLGIDYRGGSDITVTTKEQININEIKKDVNELNIEATDMDYINNNSLYIKLDDVLTKEESETVNDYFTSKYDADVEIGVVSNIVKKELTKNAFFAVMLSLVGMIIYVSFRFKFSYAVSSMTALIHDVLIVIACFAIFKLEVSSIFIASILTIIGYSINDTIVIFDRIREIIKTKHKGIVPDKEVLKGIVNDSLRSTLTRTIFTTTTVLFPIISLIFLGAYEINNFNIAILIGLIAGVYSTVFLAPQLWYTMELKNVGKKAEDKKIYKDEFEEINIKGINS
ncbi:MAG TPA: protein translocase subunit SecD [Mollicutes bacterium]|nr:protein translocase subunit SecD [Mollicutes bacterium]